VEGEIGAITANPVHGHWVGSEFVLHAMASAIEPHDEQARRVEQPPVLLLPQRSRFKAFIANT
jgi:hypothetical protein